MDWLIFPIRCPNCNYHTTTTRTPNARRAYIKRPQLRKKKSQYQDENEERKEPQPDDS